MKLKQVLSFIFRALRIYLAIMVSFVTAFLLLALVPLPNNYKFHLVSSGSMEPAIKVGSLALTVPVENYFPGDVVTFESGKNQFTTHRLVGFSDAEFGAVFKTQGDRNKTADTQTVGADKIVGKVILTVPYIGYLLSKIKTPVGFILAVIVPATIIVYEELKSLKNDLVRTIKNSRFFKRKQKQVVMQTVAVEDSTNKQTVFIPIIGAGLMLVTLTGAFFLDNEQSQANIFQAAEDFTQSNTDLQPLSVLEAPELVNPSPSPSGSLGEEILPTASPKL